MKTNDILALSVLFTCYLGYHFFYLIKSHGKSGRTRERVINHYRYLWLDEIIKSKNQILAIQTIRNLTMTNTFFISLSMILMGALGSIFSVNMDWITMLESSNYLSFLEGHPVAIKLLVAILFLLIAAFNFTYTLRILYNMNFTSSSIVDTDGSRTFRMEQITRQSTHFMTGIRSLYFFFAPMIWILNSWLMIVFSIVVVTLLYRFDFITADTARSHEGESGV